ncbi:hypothetical protein SynBIOSE41_00818 [Synechococcus sp. BIOS-E4-1]|uniref:hypothetical protein n=1 Tax=Synechococcus sp. BIOS-E4-1 TaxID=1400864 RepID=UPI001646573A|nr:hypothetical protein [Synechococcus sp. BIOS-E4-1]QNI53350.1 hypothetical protein SynBIOSE41_00818 [Synechococcus sp. BIOS-E4-1]
MTTATPTQLTTDQAKELVMNGLEIFFSDHYEDAEKSMRDGELGDEFATAIDLVGINFPWKVSVSL